MNTRPNTPSDLEDEFDAGPWPAWSRLWHVWSLLIPRTSIDGTLVWGRVWRRYDGRKWIYKRLADLEDLH
jgi:hypothetical protein